MNPSCFQDEKGFASYQLSVILLGGQPVQARGFIFSDNLTGLVWPCEAMLIFKYALCNGFQSGRGLGSN